MKRLTPIRVFRTSFGIRAIALSKRLVAAGGIKLGSRGIQQPPVASSVQATVWDLDTGERVTTVKRPGWQIRVELSPDGGWLAIIGNDLKLWDIAGSRPVAKIGRHGCYVRTCEFSPDHRWLAIGFEDGQIELLRTRQLASERCLNIKRAEFLLAFAPDSRSLAVTSRERGQGVIKLYSVPDLEFQRTLRSPCKGPILSSYFGADGESLVLVDENGAAHLWSSSDSQWTSRSLALPKEVWSVCPTPDLKGLLVGSCTTKLNRSSAMRSSRGPVHVYPLTGSAEPSSFLAHRDCVLGLASSATDNVFATARALRR